MDESRDTKTEVVRYVLSQPALQGKRVLMVGDRNDDMRGAATVVWMLPVCCTATAAGRAGSFPSGAAGRKLRRPYRPAAGSPV